MDKGVAEHAIDLIKTTTVIAPPVTVGLFGISLEDWMLIASIVASVFIILDKLPSLVGRYRGWTKKQSSDGSNSSPPDKPPG